MDRTTLSTLTNYAAQLMIVMIAYFAGTWSGPTPVPPPPQPLPTPDVIVPVPRIDTEAVAFVYFENKLIKAPEIETVARTRFGTYQIIFHTQGKPSQTLSLTVSDKTPEPLPPPPQPNPEPNPNPPQPNPEPELSAFAKKFFDQTTDLPKNECRNVSLLYESIASKIAAGGIHTLTQAFTEIQTESKSLKLTKEKWLPVQEWLNTEKPIKSLSEFKTSLEDMAAALKKRGNQ